MPQNDYKYNTDYKSSEPIKTPCHVNEQDLIRAFYECMKLFSLIELNFVN